MHKSTRGTEFGAEENNNNTNPNNYFWHQLPVGPKARMSSGFYWVNEAVDESGNFKIARLSLTGHIFYSSLQNIGPSGRPDGPEIEVAKPSCCR